MLAKWLWAVIALRWANIIASRPGDVWCWDVTFLPAQIQGCRLYFYLALDLYSRKSLFGIISCCGISCAP